MHTLLNSQSQRVEQNFKFIGHESAFLHIGIERKMYKDATFNTVVKLISYETVVASIEYDYINDTCYLFCNGNYSMSTIKHLRWFTEQFTGENLYPDIIAKLKRAVQLNNEGCCITYIDILLNGEKKDRVCDTVNRYLQSGQHFTKYSKEPNYDFLYYGCSRFDPTNL